jgi:hypothetical protein
LHNSHRGDVISQEHEKPHSEQGWIGSVKSDDSPLTADTYSQKLSESLGAIFV